MSLSRRAIAIAVGALLTLTACGTATLPTGAERFEIPTWDWDKSGGNEALVSGRLSLTDDGCTLLVSGDDQASPVLFPNAEGIRFDNGVRAVVEAGSGEVYAVEGQEFSYSGGWSRPGEQWTEPCGAYLPDDIAWVNDEPAQPALTAAPEPLTGNLPTTIASLEERGWYAVPTFSWDPADGGDSALLTGTVTMTDDGCAVIATSDGTTGLVIPNAWGSRTVPGYAPNAIYSWFPQSSGVMAEDGMDVAFGGSGTDLTGEVGEQWQQLCPSSPVDGLFLVQDDTPWD